MLASKSGLLFFFLLISKLLFGQVELVLGDTLISDKGVVSHQLSDGSIWMIGTSTLGTVGGADIVAVKFDSLGNYLSPFYYYGTVDNDYANNMIYRNGQFIIAGESHSLNGVDACILIIDSLGALISFQTYGQSNQSEQFYDIEGTQDGGFVVTGFSSTAASIGNDFLIAKFDSLAQQEWLRIHELGANETSVCILENPAGGYLIAGDQLQSFGGFNVAVLACDSAGFMLWDTIVPSPYNGGCKSMISLGNQVMIVGEMATATSTTFDIYLVRMDWQGNTIWQGSIPKSDNGDAAFDVIATSNNSFLLAGYSYIDSNKGTDLMVMQVDSMGTILDEKYYGSTGFDMAYDIKPARNDSYIITGFTNRPDNQYYLIVDSFSPLSPVDKIKNNKDCLTDLYLFPNPSSDYIVIPNQLIGLKVEIIAVTGRSQAATIVQDQLIIKHLQKGIYWLVFSNNSGRVIFKDAILKN